jgi:hypothetical protein
MILFSTCVFSAVDRLIVVFDLFNPRPASTNQSRVVREMFFVRVEDAARDARHVGVVHDDVFIVTL